MTITPSPTTRRSFLQTTTAACALAAAALPATAASAAAAAAPRKIKLGIDNFGVRGLKWKGQQLIDYAASLRLDSLFITDLESVGDLEEKNLRELRARAADKGMQIQLGSWSICPTSKSFKKNWGTAEEHLALGIKSAKALGSAVFRVILGTGADRLTEGGIEARIADTVKVCKALRNQAMDAGVKIAVENHAGDMQAWELVTLIEAAGRDYVGANLDSGNAAWTLEDPLQNLEILGPYTITTSLRDSMIWESTNGATIQWTAMGEGVVDLKAYFKRFAELCPDAPVHIETISGFNREFAYLKPEFWKAFPKARAADFAKFLALAKKGKPMQPFQTPAGADKVKAEQEYQKGEIERSIKYCREVLGLGEKA